MIKILVISDTHGDLTRLNTLAVKYNDFDYFLHLGDSQTPSYLLHPFTSVKGNCDFNFNYPPYKTITTPYGSIYMEHISSLNHDIDKLILKKETIFLNGHTHIAQVKKVSENKFIANPGSLNRPRDESNGTYLIIEWSETSLNFKICEYDSPKIIKYSY